MMFLCKSGFYILCSFCKIKLLCITVYWAILTNNAIYMHLANGNMARNINI